jgi:hypothetical protein
MERLFSVIGFPQGDNPALLATLCPDHDHHAVVEKADGDPARLSIILAVILRGVACVGEDLFGAPHIETAHLERPIPLGRIKINLHFLLLHKINGVKIFVVTKNIFRPGASQTFGGFDQP